MLACMFFTVSYDQRSHLLSPYVCIYEVLVSDFTTPHNVTAAQMTASSWHRKLELHHWLLPASALGPGNYQWTIKNTSFGLNF